MATQIPEGWYPDPAGPPAGLRWWDGSQWTAHVAPGSPYAGPAVRATTLPDGDVLASYGARVGAYLIDGLIVSLLGLLIGFPFVLKILQTFSGFLDHVTQAQEQGRQPPSGYTLNAHNAGPFLGLAAVSLAVNVAYQVGFLKALAGTPGKLALGLRVRLREQPGPLSWGTVFRRWFGQFGYGLVSWVPIVGSVVGLYVVVDLPWPAWDGRRQALHDKFARTNVIRAR